MCLVHQIDQVQSEKFAEELMDTLNKGALSLMLSIGHQTKLFDTMENLPPSTSEEIALAAGLQERYVREWLAAMVAAGVVSITGKGPVYQLPAAHAAFLTRSAGADNIALFAQHITGIAQVESEVINCFSQGGGVPYEKYNRFHQVMAEDSGSTVLSSLQESILPLIPGIKHHLEKGIEVLDLGCGRGKAMIMLAQIYPNSHFTGIDLCQEPIEQAREEVKKLGLNNVSFVQADLTHYKPEGKYHLVTTFDGVHDQARPDILLKTIYDCLQEDGFYLMQDIDASSNPEENMDKPLATFLYTISCMHCMTVSLAQGGMGLGTMWGIEKAEEMLKEAGFSRFELHRLEHDFQNFYMVIQK